MSRGMPRLWLRCLGSLWWSVVLTTPLLSPVTAAADTSQANVGATQTTQEFALAEGEIRLDGKLHVANAAQRTCTLEVLAFTLPNGKASRLSRPKTKIIVVDDQTLIHVRGDRQQLVSLGALRDGTTAVVLGQDLGSGKSLPAREIAVWDRLAGGIYAWGTKTSAAPPRPTVLAPPGPMPQAPSAQTPAAQTPVAQVAAVEPPVVPQGVPLTWRDGPLLEVQIGTSTPLSSPTRIQAAPGSPPPRLANGIAPARIFRTVLKSPLEAPADATALLTMPAGLKRASPGKLNVTRPQEVLEQALAGSSVPLRLELYWGSGVQVAAAQPRSGQVTSVAMNYYSRVGRPAEKLTGIPTVAVGPLRTSPGLPGSGVPIVGLPGAEPLPDAAAPSAAGDYALTTSYAGNVAFHIEPDQDFLAAPVLTLPPDPPDFAQPVTISWNTVPRALGYRVIATGMRQPNDGTNPVAVLWTAAAIPPAVVDQIEPITDPNQAVQDGRLLPATATSATIPAGVLAGATAVRCFVEAIGPVRVTPGRPNVRVATTADATVGFGLSEASVLRRPGRLPAALDGGLGAP